MNELAGNLNKLIKNQYWQYAVSNVLCNSSDIRNNKFLHVHLFIYFLFFFLVILILKLLFNCYKHFINRFLVHVTRVSIHFYRKQCPCSSKVRRKDQTASPCCCSEPISSFRASLRQQAAEGKCSPCAEPEPCPPCCVTTGFKPFGDLLSKETVKKCGCPVKDYSCNCGKKK